jgi:hypothetical protein
MKMPEESPASNTNLPDANPPARDLTGGADVSGFIGVDPMYQNYSTDAGKPYNTKEEQKLADYALTVGTKGANAVTEGEMPKEDEPPVKAKTNDDNQVLTEGGERPQATIAPGTEPSTYEVESQGGGDSGGSSKSSSSSTKAPAKD